MIQRFKDDDVGDVGGLSWFSHRRNSGRHTPGNAPRTSAVIIIVIIIAIIIIVIAAISGIRVSENCTQTPNSRLASAER